MDDRHLRIVRVDETLRVATAEIIAEYIRAIHGDQTREKIDAEIARHLAHASSALWLAYAGDDPVGCIELHPLDAEPLSFEIKRVYVRAQARRLGVALELMRTAEAHARALGATRILLDTKPSMEAAIALYRSLGYVPIDPYNEDSECRLHFGKALS